MTVTIKDVAARAGVSPKTVSRVLNGEAYVRDAVREAVLGAIEALSYRPNVFARSLSSARSYLIGLFLDDPTWSGYAAAMQRGALHRCRERHYHLVVELVDIDKPGFEDEMLASIAALHLDGVILTAPVCRHDGLLSRLEAARLPYVRVSPGENPLRSAAVDIDETRAASDITRHLIALGHRDIAFIEGIPTHAATPKRRAGFEAAMHEAGLPVDPRRIVGGDFTVGGGRVAGEALLSSSDVPSAIFASNDDMALGAMAVASQRGIAVPEQLSIAGFDDSYSARIAWPTITTIRQPIMEMAATAVDILVDRQYRETMQDPTWSRVLPHELILRESTAPAPARPFR
ncbi:LacI family DNA-binding transcriptional regulator [Novosphingobium sp. 1949]|uniref:LacI family DNA-binding transcriptional regulator n=1 Tax=Novosphingobium organovorum TaxID=2930092 RepID=A0ABT0BHC1_9SPHN|nr:LacI family DNA-binding transcriptional regulator [Novosphingobium organovorum]MCJ2184467.1 LacI family DNA-binding transcriptional regulator [Novosphingobium organovorum]